MEALRLPKGLCITRFIVLDMTSYRGKNPRQVMSEVRGSIYGIGQRRPLSGLTNSAMASGPVFIDLGSKARAIRAYNRLHCLFYRECDRGMRVAYRATKIKRVTKAKKH